MGELDFLDCTNRKSHIKISFHSTISELCVNITIFDYTKTHSIQLLST